MPQTTFVKVLVLTVIFTGVSWGLSDLFDAFEKMDPVLQEQFNLLGPNLLTELDSASKCMAEQFRNFSICHFNTSFDPFYYIQTCLKGTTLQKMVEDFVRNVPVANLSFGIPPVVSNDRCDCDRVPQLSCLSPSTVSPITVPPVVTLSPSTSLPIGGIGGKR